MKDADVILTTYGVLKNDFEEYKEDIELYRLGFPINWYDLMIK